MTSIISIIAIENYRVVPEIFNIAIQMLYFLSMPLVSLFFILYLISEVWEFDKKIYTYMWIASIPYVLYLPFVLSNPFTGILYKISEIDGFKFGNGFILTYLVPILYMFIILLVVISRRVKMEPFLRKGLLYFPIISLIIMGIQIIYPEIILSGTATASAIMVLFIYHLKREQDVFKESENKYKSLFDLGSGALLLIDKETGEILQVNDSACDIYGYSHDEMLKTNVIDMSAEPQKTERSIKETNESKTLVPMRYHKKKDGTVFPVEITASLFDRNSREVLLVSVRDITQRLNSEKTLRYNEEKFKAITQISMDGYWVIDKDGNILEVNDAYSKMIGYSVEDLLTMNISDISVSEDMLQTSEHMNEIKKQGWDKFESIHRKADGSIITVHISVTFIADKELYISFISDITERKRAEEEIKHLVYHDGLTGLYNRSFFEEEVARLSVDRQMPISIIMGDINGLKLINDGFGHENGDKVIINIASILRNCCREEDVVARVGGDEFCILLPKSDEAIVQRICDNIYKECEKQGKQNKDGLQFVSISLGSTTRTNAHESIEVIMKEAESAMYKHKLLETRSLRSSVVSSIISTLHERYVETAEHSRRAQILCRKIGLALGVSDSIIDDLKLLAILHDIGKVAIDDKIINKTGELTEEERKEMQRHCEIGYHITQSTLEFQHISEYILTHHERWDGTGYPRHIKGEDIPLLARILSIIDAYDAMVNDRLYRKALTAEEAVMEIKKFSGTQFDPNLAKIFIEKVLEVEWE